MRRSKGQTAGTMAGRDNAARPKTRIGASQDSETNRTHAAPTTNWQKTMKEETEPMSWRISRKTLKAANILHKMAQVGDSAVG
ncbi:MAG: hypothetical protein M1376_02620 [Planctomycetes bacterium]|nr:hypothetical protein [Planctomycetota bacterium]